MRKAVGGVPFFFFLSRAHGCSTAAACLEEQRGCCRCPPAAGRRGGDTDQLVEKQEEEEGGIEEGLARRSPRSLTSPAPLACVRGQVYDALNALSSTPWSVNPDVFKVVESSECCVVCNNSRHWWGYLACT